MNLRIETAGEKDISAIIELMREFAEYENLLEYLEITEAKLYQAMFGAGGFVECLIASDDEKPVAYALFYLNFASFRGQTGIFLEDLYITENYRGRGLGEMLLRQIARVGKAGGAVRMDFQVLDWNAPAISFYKKHGAKMDESERHFKFTDEAFDRLAS